MTLGVLERTEVPAPTHQGWGRRTTNGWDRSKEDADFPLTWSTQNLLKLEHTSKSLRERQIKKRGRHTTPQFSEQARAHVTLRPSTRSQRADPAAMLCRAGPGWAWRGSHPICEASLDSHTTSQAQAGPGSARDDRVASAAHLSTLLQGGPFATH